VLLSEVALGRLLMVLQTDPANHVKKVGSPLLSLAAWLFAKAPALLAAKPIL
jgi:hypothetical protein